MDFMDVEFEQLRGHLGLSHQRTRKKELREIGSAADKLIQFGFANRGQREGIPLSWEYVQRRKGGKGEREKGK